MSLAPLASLAQCTALGPGTGGGVYCLYPDTQAHCLYVGGGFQYCGLDTFHYCSYWDDTVFHPMGMGMGYYGTNDSVWCYAMMNGNLYCGGAFTLAGGMTANGIARWDGQAWQAVGDGFDNTVYALEVYNGHLYAGGAFHASGGVTMNGLAWWDGSQWNQAGGGLDGTVMSLCAWNNSLYVGGVFSMAGGVPVNRICRWDGNAFFAMGSGFPSGMMGSAVYALCPYNGQLCAGGMFQQGTGMHNIAVWNGGNWMSIGNIGGSGANAVHAMAVYNGMLFVGGSFGNCGGNQSNNIGMWNGSTWSTLGTGMNGTVRSMGVYDGALYLGGSFTDANGTTASNVVKYTQPTGLQSVAIKAQSLTVYPNPARQYVQVEWTQDRSAPVVYTVYDLNGRMLRQDYFGTLEPGFHKREIPVYQWNNGRYLLVLDGDVRRESHVVIAR